jgi:enoyl-[acyl-carrier-protein] reductase (NADH)
VPSASFQVSQQAFSSANICNSAGIGYATVTELARHGAKVYLAARSESKALAAIKKLHAEIPKIPIKNLVWLPLDLTDLDDVARATRTFLGKEDRLDILGASSATKWWSDRKDLHTYSQQCRHGCSQLYDYSSWMGDSDGSEVCPRSIRNSIT